MNKALKTIYLAGPINGCSDSECNEWRAFASLALQDWGYTLLNPMCRDYRGCEQENLEELVQLDIADIKVCDYVLANAFKPTWGTAMEIFLAKQLGKTVVSIIPSGFSPWLEYYTDIKVKSVKEAITYFMGVR